MITIRRICELLLEAETSKLPETSVFLGKILTKIWRELNPLAHTGSDSQCPLWEIIKTWRGSPVTDPPRVISSDPETFLPLQKVAK